MALTANAFIVTSTRSYIMAFYEDKGMIRYTVILTPQNKEKLADIAKRFDVSQIDLVNILVEDANADDLFLQSRLAKIAAAKEANRPLTVSAVAKKIKTLSPEKLAEIDRLIGAPT